MLHVNNGVETHCINLKRFYHKYLLGIYYVPSHGKAIGKGKETENVEEHATKEVRLEKPFL